MRVLIVEDDPLLGDALAAGLKQRGFDADWVQDGRDAQAAIRVDPFVAVVLDLVWKRARKEPLPAAPRATPST